MSRDSASEHESHHAGTGTIRKVSLSEKFAQFSDHWSPKIVGALNGQHVKLARLKGEFVWHHHEKEDELFLVIEGALTIRFRNSDGAVWEEEINEGEFLIVPRGVEHAPYAREEVQVLLFEPASTVNTGEAGGEMTVEELEWI